MEADCSTEGCPRGAGGVRIDERRAMLGTRSITTSPRTRLGAKRRLQAEEETSAERVHGTTESHTATTAFSTGRPLITK